MSAIEMKQHPTWRSSKNSNLQTINKWVALHYKLYMQPICFRMNNALVLVGYSPQTGRHIPHCYKLNELIYLVYPSNKEISK